MLCGNERLIVEHLSDLKIGRKKSLSLQNIISKIADYFDVSVDFFRPVFKKASPPSMMTKELMEMPRRNLRRPGMRTLLRLSKNHT